MPLTPEEIAELTADPSPLNPLPMTMYGAPAGPVNPNEVPQIPGREAARATAVPLTPGERTAEGLVRMIPETALSVMANQAIPGSGFLPGLGRTVAQGVLGGGQAALEGRPMSDIATAAGLGIAGQGALGELPAAGVKVGMLQGAGRRAEEGNAAARAAFDREVADVKARNEAAKLGYLTQKQSITKRNILGAQAHEGIRGEWIEGRTNQFMDALKKEIPEFDALPKGAEGLREYMFGKGYNIIHEGYDKAIKDLVGQAAGKTIDISPETAKVFGIRPAAGGGGSLTPQQATILQNIKDPAHQAEVLQAMGLTEGGGYDAAQAITAITGKWKKNPEAYREVGRALSDAGLTNPMAEKYKTAIGLQTFIQKSGAMKENGTMDPALLQKALYDVNKVQELQRRDIGGVSSGKLQAFLGGPGAFKETPLPNKPIPEAMPREPVPTDVKYGPLMSGTVRHGATFAIPTYAAHSMGLPYPAAAGVGLGSALLANKFLPAGKRVVDAPLSDRQMELLRLLPMLGGATGAAGARDTFLGNMQ